MFKSLATISQDELGGQNRLFAEYVAGAAGVAPFLPSLVDGSKAVMSKGTVNQWAAITDDQMPVWKSMTDEVTELSKRLGASADILTKLGSASARHGRFVVAGQQPGALGGPLYATYKIATAIALAARIEESSGVPCLALYWCGADDTDFQEIRDLHLITHDLSVVSAAIAQDGHATGLPVGDIDKKHIEDVWTNVGPFIDEHAGGATVRAVAERAFATARDHGELAAGMLMGLLGGQFAVVDGRSSAVRRYARSVFIDYLRDEDTLKNQVTQSGASLESAGYHSQINVGKDSGVFIVEKGRRHAVAESDRSILLEAAQDRVEACSPGVVVRNLVQDFAFEPLAVVLGPAEIAYRAQIGELYGHFGVRRPLEFPRMAGTFVPPELAPLLDKPERPRELLEDPHRFTKAIYRTMAPDALQQSMVDFKTDMTNALTRLSDRVHGELPGKSAGKWQGKVKDLHGRIEQLATMADEVGKGRAVERWPFLPDVDRWVRPAGKPQERSISSLTPFLFADTWQPEGPTLIAREYVDELVDGRSKHIVYSV